MVSLVLVTAHGFGIPCLQKYLPSLLLQQNVFMASKANDLWERRMQNIKLRFAKYYPSHVIIRLQKAFIINISTQGYNRTRLCKLFTLASTTSQEHYRESSNFSMDCVQNVSAGKILLRIIKQLQFKSSPGCKEWDSVTFCLFTYQNTFSLPNQFNYVLIGLNSSSCSQH